MSPYRHWVQDLGNFNIDRPVFIWPAVISSFFSKIYRFCICYQNDTGALKWMPFSCQYCPWYHMPALAIFPRDTNKRNLHCIVCVRDLKKPCIVGANTLWQYAFYDVLWITMHFISLFLFSILYITNVTLHALCLKRHSVRRLVTMVTHWWTFSKKYFIFWKRQGKKTKSSANLPLAGFIYLCYHVWLDVKHWMQSIR